MVRIVIKIYEDATQARMAGNFKELLYEMLRNYKHLYDVSSPGHRDNNKKNQ